MDFTDRRFFQGLYVMLEMCKETLDMFSKADMFGSEPFVILDIVCNSVMKPESAPIKDKHFQDYSGWQVGHQHHHH